MHARNAYLTAQVMSATPQKLQLMLIEGALRFAGQAKKLWEEESQEAARESLRRAEEILAQMIASVEADGSELTHKVADVYVFVYRSLIEAHLRSEPEQLDQALRVLEEERITWCQLCEKLGSTVDAPDASPKSSTSNGSSDDRGLSFEA